MTTTTERDRRWQGPAFFSYGFRTFFFSGGLLSALAILVWAPVYLGFVPAPSALGAMNWHIHELLYGYVPAVIAGFLLTAVPSWTGRTPVLGWPLAALWGLWLVGRLAVIGSTHLGPAMLALIALLFPLALAAVTARELVLARNWRNLKVLAVLGMLTLSQAAFHAEVAMTGRSDLSSRAGIAATLMLIMIVAGRIVPIFTRNWIRRENPGREPAEFSGFDRLCMIVAGVALSIWCAGPLVPALDATVALAMLCAGVLHLWRLLRWAPHRTGKEPLVSVLHVAYAFIPTGFLFGAVASWIPNPAWHQASVHAWTAGAIGLMTLAVMTRASRGHSGRPLTAPVGTVLIYVCVFLATLLRLALAFRPEATMLLLPLSSLLWTVGFALFCVLYAPMFFRR